MCSKLPHVETLSNMDNYSLFLYTLTAFAGLYANNAQQMLVGIQSLLDVYSLHTNGIPLPLERGLLWYGLFIHSKLKLKKSMLRLWTLIWPSLNLILMVVFQ